jgi:hypothetical protein
MLQCCNAAMHRSNLLIHSFPENRFQSLSADFVQNFSDSQKKVICRPELLSLEAVFEIPKQEKEILEDNFALEDHWVEFVLRQHPAIVRFRFFNAEQFRPSSSDQATKRNPAGMIVFQKGEACRHGFRSKKG